MTSKSIYIYIYIYICVCVCVFVCVCVCFFHGSTTLLGLGLLIEHTSGQVISQSPQDTGTDASGGIQTRNTSKRPAADPRFRPSGHQDRPVRCHYTKIHWSTCKIHSELRQPDWAWMAPLYCMPYLKLTYISCTYLEILKKFKISTQH